MAKVAGEDKRMNKRKVEDIEEDEASHAREHLQRLVGLNSLKCFNYFWSELLC